MCRMLGIVPKINSNIAPSLLSSFRVLAVCGQVKNGSSPGHGDGWGVVAWNSDLPYYLGREPTDAKSDSHFDAVLEKLGETPVSSPLIAHLRKASVGSKTKENTHPFLSGKWAFAHNGTIRKLNLRNTTDSEWFFHQIMERLKPCNGDMVCAIARELQSVRQTYKYSSLTFLLSDGSNLFAYRDYAESGEYYTMFYTKTHNAFVVCQEKIFDSQWKELGNGELLTIDRKLNYLVTDMANLVPEEPALRV